MHYPALDVSGADQDLVLAVVDDFSPSAVEERDDRFTVFFSNSQARNGAHDALRAAFPAARLTARDVDDEDWARRSQENLQPIAVGHITVRPPWSPPSTRGESSIDLVIAPSMGFGTGHHATTRLCLEALQQIEVTNKTCLDVGTGSGVLALAARRLGAASTLGIDVDADAIQSARENLSLNPSISKVAFDTADLRTLAGQTRPVRFDIVTANLTGALLVQSREILTNVVAERGSLIVSGLMTGERRDVESAFGALRLAWTRTEEEWVGLRFERNSADRPRG